MIAAYWLARVARVAGSGCWWPSAGMGSGQELLLHVSMMTPLLQLQTSTITREQQNPRPATSQHLNIWPQFQCNYDNSLLWSWETQNSCPFPLLLQHTIARCDNYLSITNARTDTVDRVCILGCFTLLVKVYVWSPGVCGEGVKSVSETGCRIVIVKYAVFELPAEFCKMVDRL